MASESSSASGPAWADASAPNRPAPVEDHHGNASSSIIGGGGTGMDELLAPVSTLDEPVKETIMRDVRAVGAKLRAVLIPIDRTVSVTLVGRGWAGRGCVVSPTSCPQDVRTLTSSRAHTTNCNKTPQKRPFGYVDVLQEEEVSPNDGQRNVLNQLRDWDLW